MKRLNFSNVYLRYVLFGIAVILVAVALSAINRKPVTDPPPAPPVQSEPPVPEIQADSKPSTPSKQYPRVGLPYIENGYRFQFVHCSGTPGSLVIKAGKYFLLDNRDAQPHTFAVAGQSYKVGAYGATVAAVWKVGTYPITCDGGGAASLTVQK